MKQGGSGPKSDHNVPPQPKRQPPPMTTRTVEGDTTATTKPKGKSRSPRQDVPNYEYPKSPAGTTTHYHDDSTGVAPAAGKVGGAASMNEKTSSTKTKPSPFAYPRHDSASTDDSAADFVAEADEATIPVVDAAFAPPEGGGDNDPRAERLRAAEQRAADAEAGRQEAERRLAHETRSLRERLASLSKRQWLGIGLATSGLLVIAASATFAVCGPDMCSKKKVTTATTTSRPPATSPPLMLSARAQFIVDYINNITLTGRTLTYPDYDTPEGRALAWLVDSSDNNGESAINRTFFKPNDVSLRQRYALTTLWFQTPDHFVNTFLTTINNTWGNPAVHECDWYGVTCDRSTGRVEMLQLEEIVRGGIPADLALLTGLIVLELSLSSHLVGTIPSSLGRLDSLDTLRLFDNALTGTIPAELAALMDLTALFLHSNDLTGPIPTAFAFGALTALELSDNRLTGTIPSSFVNLTALRTLHLFNNRLSGTIPSSVGALMALQNLSLSGNDLTGTIPASFASLKVTNLLLNDNRLTGTIPTALASMTSLQHLFLHNNQLSGTVPSLLSKVTTLVKLRLFNNTLTGTIPSQLGDLAVLEELGLSNNSLTGTIPSSLTALTALTALYLFNNPLTGSVPFCSNNLNQTTVAELVADCNKVVCPCCSHCCPVGGWDGIPGIPADWNIQCE